MKNTYEKTGRCVVIILCVFFIALLSGCAFPFVAYNAGIGVLYIGDLVSVGQECARRGVVPSAGMQVLGCTDFSRREMFSIEDSRVIAHEFCHLSTWDPSHENCGRPIK